MEPAKIDWKDSTFVEDEVYEHINAPKWVDFSVPDEPVYDDAWFCRPGCKHPKSVEDFVLLTPNSKANSVDLYEKTLPLGQRNRRDACMKRRGIPSSMVDSKFKEDGENENPNLSTPINKPLKAAIKSSTEKKQPIDNCSLENENAPKLKSTLSARNLFGGNDILNQITEFCKDLKRMATKARERENVEKINVEQGVEEGSSVVSDVLEGKEKERIPLTEKETVKKLRRKKRTDEAENVPINLNLENVKCKGEGSLLSIRTNPPSPQCFSATHAPAKTPLSTASRLRGTEKGILREVEQNKGTIREEPAEKARSSTTEGREARTLDVFWFLKPCTLST